MSSAPADARVQFVSIWGRGNHRMSPFRRSVRLSALSLLLAAGLAGAAEATPINYNVNFSIGKAQITGTIQTNGTLGVLGGPTVLNPSQILNWSLNLSDGAHTCAKPFPGGLGGPCSVDLAGPFGTIQNGGLQTDGLFGNDLIATATQLTFDFSGGPGFLFFAGTPGGEVCLSAGGICAISQPGFNSAVRINPGHRVVASPFLPNGRVDYQYRNITAPLLLGTATPVPEPSSLAVMAGALAILALFGFGRVRKFVPARPTPARR